MATLITFEDIKTLFDQGASLLNFKCINPTSDRSPRPCTKLDGLRLEKARSILARGKQSLTPKTLRDLIKCLLCKDDQKAAKHLLRRWCEELGIPIPPLGRPRKSLDASGSSRVASRSPSSSRSSPERNGPPSEPALVTPCPLRSDPARGTDENTCIEGQHGADAMDGIAASNDVYKHRIAEARTGAARTVSREPSSQRHVPTEPQCDGGAFQEEYQADSSDASCTEVDLVDISKDFTPGDSFEATDGVICQNLLEAFLKPINPGSTTKKTDVGWVYAARVQGYKQDLVKIGLTGLGVKTRLRQIEGTHRVTFDKTSFVATTQYSNACLRRLERVVFAELAGYQRILKRECASERREYYAIDLATAKTTILRWSERMRQLDFCEGVEIDSRLRRFIWSRQNALLLKSRTSKAANNGAQPDERFSHHDRQTFWAEVFLDDIGGAKMALQPPYTFACIVCALSMFFGLALYLCAPRLLMILLLVRCLWSVDYEAWHVYWLRRMQGKAAWPALKP